MMGCWQAYIEVILDDDGPASHLHQGRLAAGNAVAKP